MGKGWATESELEETEESDSGGVREKLERLVPHAKCK